MVGFGPISDQPIADVPIGGSASIPFGLLPGAPNYVLPCDCCTGPVEPPIIPTVYYCGGCPCLDDGTYPEQWPSNITVKIEELTLTINAGVPFAGVYPMDSVPHTVVAFREHGRYSTPFYTWQPMYLRTLRFPIIEMPGLHYAQFEYRLGVECQTPIDYTPGRVDVQSWIFAFGGYVFHPWCDQLGIPYEDARRYAIHCLDQIPLVTPPVFGGGDVCRSGFKTLEQNSLRELEVTGNVLLRSPFYPDPAFPDTVATTFTLKMKYEIIAGDYAGHHIEAACPDEGLSDVLPFSLPDSIIPAEDWSNPYPGGDEPCPDPVDFFALYPDPTPPPVTNSGHLMRVSDTRWDVYTADFNANTFFYPYNPDGAGCCYPRPPDLTGYLEWTGAEWYAHFERNGEVLYDGNFDGVGDYAYCSHEGEYPCTFTFTLCAHCHPFEFASISEGGTFILQINTSPDA